MKLQELSSNVYILSAHPDDDKVQPVIGAVIGNQETILIDAGNSPRHAQLMLDELKRMAAPPVTQIIYTHWHWDHVFGACVFDAPALSHRLCKEKLLEEVHISWSEAYLQEEVKRDPNRVTRANILREGVDDWGNFRIVMPSKIFETSEVLDGEGYRLELLHINSKHSPDSIIVTVVGENVMFVADAFYPAPLRYEPNDQTLDLKVLRAMLKSSCTQFVHGHGEVLSRENVQEILEESV
jgi:glyoxylase-like metal-dependent hydrolase (beta-lactamase superfamily II)